MSAQAIVSAFAEFLADPGGLLPADALNPEPLIGAATDRDYAFLSDAAIPADPSRAAIVAVIDDAIPFAHQMLRHGDVSRVAAFWAQDARPSLADGDMPWGREWRGSGIDGLLRRLATGDLPDEDSLYRAAGVLDYGRGLRPSAGYAHGHGAAVSVLAAGFRPDDPAARSHPVIAVSLPSKLTEDSMGASAPPYIMAAILFVVLRARQLCRFIEQRRGLARGSLRMPVVINISYGLTAGPRDGSTLLERLMDELSRHSLPDLGPIRFVLPMGNHRQAMLVGRLRPGERLIWRLRPGDQTASAVEIWGPPLNRLPQTPFAVHLSAPGQPATATAFTAEGQVSILRDSAGDEIARAYYQRQRSADNRWWREGITIIAMPTCPEKAGDPWAPPGDWELRIDPAAADGVYEISVQRDESIPGYPREARQSVLFDHHYQICDPTGRVRRDDPPRSLSRVRRRNTLNAYAGGAETLRAGAALLAPLPPGPGVGPDGRAGSIYSGMQKNGRNGDVQAVADRGPTCPGIPVAGRDSGAILASNGTSVATPQLARWLAVQMAAGFRPADRAQMIQGAWGAAPVPPEDDVAPVLPFTLSYPEY